MMTNGPRARVGEILHVPFARPRRRAHVLDDAQYYPLRERLWRSSRSKSAIAASTRVVEEDGGQSANRSIQRVATVGAAADRPAR